MTLDLVTRGRRTPRLRIALVGVVALVSWALAGCGDPDGGGGGYVTGQAVEQPG